MSILARLLHLANSAPPSNRQAFYGLKQALLRKYATPTRTIIQEITKSCYGRRDYEGDWLGCRGTGCPRCGGSGVYERKWFALWEWRWGKYVFHTPSERIWERPAQIDVAGRIEHHDYGRKAYEAGLWLYLLCGYWGLLGRALTGGYCCGWYAWPLLNLQRVATELSMFLAWRKCWCGRRFPTWGSGWCICRKCRRDTEDGQDRSDEGVPF